MAHKPSQIIMFLLEYIMIMNDYIFVKKITFECLCIYCNIGPEMQNLYLKKRK